MKETSRFLSVFLVLALIFSCSACASGTGSATGSAAGSAANEVAAADAILEFTRQLIEEPSIEYTKLTGFTDEGKAKLEQQRKERGCTPRS